MLTMNKHIVDVFYVGHPINKIQNEIILLIFLKSKIYVMYLIIFGTYHIHLIFYEDCFITVTSHVHRLCPIKMIGLPVNILY